MLLHIISRTTTLHWWQLCKCDLSLCVSVLSVCLPRSTQPSIPPGSVNECQLRLGRQRQFIPLADERGMCIVQVKLWDPLRTRTIPERVRRLITTRCYTNPHLPLPLPLWLPGLPFYSLRTRWQTDRRQLESGQHISSQPSLLPFVSVVFTCWLTQSVTWHGHVMTLSRDSIAWSRDGVTCLWRQRHVTLCYTITVTLSLMPFIIIIIIIIIIITLIFHHFTLITDVFENSFHHKRETACGNFTRFTTSV